MIHPLQQQIEDAEATLAELRRRQKAGDCAKNGHEMTFRGGANCGCEEGNCSVPVYCCVHCGDCDYGDNPEAAEIRADCALLDPGPRL